MDIEVDLLDEFSSSYMQILEQGANLDQQIDSVTAKVTY